MTRHSKERWKWVLEVGSGVRRQIRGEERKDIRNGALGLETWVLVAKSLHCS